MFYVLLLLFGCTALAYLSENKQYEGADNPIEEKTKQTFGLRSVLFIALLITLVCFCGLRTFMNDTSTYLSAFDKDTPNELSQIFVLDWSIGANPLFNAFQIILKSIFSTNGQVLIFTTALITVTSMVMFIRKKAERFGFSIYLFIAFGVYAFTLSAMKQSLATAIAVWAVPLFLNGKRLRAIFLIVIAMFIHPYVTVFFALFFLHKNVWDKRAVIIIIITIISSLAFTSLVENVLNITAMIGDDYDLSSFENNGINVYRALVYLVTPVLAYVFRREIREKNDKFLNVCVNLSFISACFMVVAVSGGAILIGRLANYFDIFTCISLPMVISIGFSETSLKKTVSFFAFVGFFIFYLTYYSKYYPSLEYMFGDYYAHVPITELFRG